jgi:hypothetical protein
MSPETLAQYLPVPFSYLLDMHEPPTELDLDNLLPDLLQKSVSLDTGLVLALEVDPPAKAPLLPMTRVLTDYLTVAQKVFTVWNRRDMRLPRPEEH